MYDADDVLLYVGVSVSWPMRLYQHDTKPWFRDVARVTLEHFDDHRVALAAEGRAQADENPVYNIVRNGRVPNARERNAERRARKQADLAARGVYEAWHHCPNCRLSERVEIKLGVPRGDHPCPTCGVRATDLLPVTSGEAA
jgi:hypothetical protein